MPMRVAGGVHLINGAGRPQAAVHQGPDPPAADPGCLHGGGRRTTLDRNTGGRQLIAEPLCGTSTRRAEVRFGVTMEVDTEAERNAPAVQKFAAALADILDQDYGPDLLNFTIGIICMRSRPGYEEWYQPRKPSFRTRMRVRLLDGTSTEFANAFGYDVRLTDDEYECFVSANCFGAVCRATSKTDPLTT
jgi:hypothetical protein